jgi:hypothetical protein
MGSIPDISKRSYTDANRPALGLVPHFVTTIKARGAKPEARLMTVISFTPRLSYHGTHWLGAGLDS